MKRSNRLVLLIGVFLAVVAFVLIVILLGGGGGGPKPGASAAAPITTVVAAQDIPLGATLTTQMLKTQDFKASDRKSGAFGDPSLIVGQVVRRKITAGAQLSAADFSDNQNANLQVPPGQRAFAVQVDQVSGVGTLIKTGDYVDVVVAVNNFPVVTLNPQDDSVTVVAGLNSTSVKLVIEGVQVIGTIRPPATPSGNAQQNAAPSGSAGANPPTTTLGDDQQELVILSLSAQQVEIIKFNQEEATISLALRSPTDFVDENGQPVVTIPAGTTGVVLKTLVDSYGVLRPELVEAIIPAQ